MAWMINGCISSQSFGCLEVCLYGIRELVSATSRSFMWISDLERTTLLHGPYLNLISDRTHFIFLSSAVIFLYKDLGLMVTNIGHIGQHCWCWCWTYKYIHSRGGRDTTPLDSQLIFPVLSHHGNPETTAIHERENRSWFWFPLLM